MDWLYLERWSPYLVGIGIGVLSWVAFLLSDSPLGCSTAFARTSGMMGRIFRGSKIMQNSYYRIFPPIVDWEWMLVMGILAGAFISAKISGTFHFQLVPEKWADVFGYTPYSRTVVAFIGGFFMGIGARWAGGCTSGHGISGTLQLAVSSWIAVACFFIGGIGTAFFIYGLSV